jgi:hypothetical protein
MNGAHIHLMLNHFPLTGFFFSILVLAFGFIRGNGAILRTGLLIIVVSGAFSLPAFLTGESAEDIIRQMPAFSKALVHAHEDAADVAIWLVGITTALAALGLVVMRGNGKLTRPILIAAVTLNLISVIAIARVNNLGGKISHPEIRGP